MVFQHISPLTIDPVFEPNHYKSSRFYASYQGVILIQKILSFIVMMLLVGTILPCTPQHVAAQTPSPQKSVGEDLDPLVDLNITIDFLYIRGLKEDFLNNPPDFFIKLWINGQLYESPIWQDASRLYNPWTVTSDIPDTIDNVSIIIELWDNNDGSPRLCDISAAPNTGTTGYSVALTYHVKTGHWDGDDKIGDASGYGRLNGCDDGSLYDNQLDCELGFTLHTNDYDGDGIPYWTEVNVYGTDPTVSNLGEDADGDGVPIEWEFWWGYNPFVADNHSQLDPDNDSISNLEEYYTASFFSDPFRPDLFLEMDFMADGPHGEHSVVPLEAQERVRDPYDRRNIMFHIDSGQLNGGERIPFEPFTNVSEIRRLYQWYFLHNDSTTWRRGVFHYAMYVNATFPKGFGFSADVDPFMGYLPGTNAFIISSSLMEQYAGRHIYPLYHYYAGVTMHEVGHTLGLRHGHPPGVDVRWSAWPWQPFYWYYRTYRSVMNYHYTYCILDYSDGSHGRHDFNDWANINLSHFEIPKNFA